MSRNNIIIVIFGFLGGLFSMPGAVNNWDWFMESGKARFFVAIFGRDGARIFYILLGLFLIGMAGLTLVSVK